MKQIATAKPAPSPVIEDDSDGDDGLLIFRQLGEAVSSSARKFSGTRTEKNRVTSARCRRRFSFWLDMDKVGQVDLWEWFNELKHRREFTPVIRIAVSLYRELVNGRYDMLYRLFPETAPKPAPPPAPSTESEELKKRISILEGQVAILEQVIINTRLPSAVDNAVKMTGGVGASPRPIAPPPADDDDTPLVIRKDADAGNRAAVNFIKSAFALNGMVYEESKQ